MRVLIAKLAGLLLILAVFGAFLALGVPQWFGEWFAQSFYHPGR